VPVVVVPDGLVVVAVDVVGVVGAVLVLVLVLVVVELVVVVVVVLFGLGVVVVVVVVVCCTGWQSRLASC
jgi:hypothetical protein